MELTFLRRFPIDEYFRCVFWEKAHGNFGGHAPIDAAAYDAFAPRFFGMFRRPERRVSSAYLWFRVEFERSGYALPSPAEYAMRARGTAVKMLAGQVWGAGRSTPLPMSASRTQHA